MWSETIELKSSNEKPRERKEKKLQRKKQDETDKWFYKCYVTCKVVFLFCMFFFFIFSLPTLIPGIKL